MKIKGTDTTIAMLGALILTLSPIEALSSTDTPGTPDSGGGTGAAAPPGVPVPVPAVFNSAHCVKVKHVGAVTFPGDGIIFDVIPHNSLYPAPTCRVKKAKVNMLCYDVATIPDPLFGPIPPVPPIGSYPSNAGLRTCYVAKCEDPKKPEQGMEVIVTDRFGTHTIVPTTFFRFCAPVLDETVIPPPPTP